MITSQLHDKAESDSVALYLSCFSDLSRMFHQPEKCDDYTDSLSGFKAGGERILVSGGHA